MKKFIKVLIPFLAFLCCVVESEGQFITAAEYFINIDPGAGNGTAIIFIPGITVNANFSIPANNLVPGFNQLFIRVQNQNNNWSIAEERTFFVDNTLHTSLPAISAAEYFMDTDLGAGNGTPFTIQSGDSLRTLVNISTTGLRSGFHQLFIRVKDQNNEWSITEERTFFVDNTLHTSLPAISAAEYFMDTDPGAGNGTPFTIQSGDSLHTLVNISTTGLRSGFHQLFIRVKDQDNEWSIAEDRTFYIDGKLNSGLPPIVAAEYYVDTDSGAGNNTPIPILKGNQVDTSYDYTATNLPLGGHTINLRVEDSTGNWSLVESRPFTVGGGPLPVTLLNFSLKCAGNNVVLSWQTTREVNSGSFEIQKYSNGSTDWSTIGILSAAGSSTLLQGYQFTDEKGGGMSLYRLREVDMDGNATYSETIQSDCILAGVQVQVYPVPAKNTVNLLIHTNDNDFVNILLLDVNGKMIKQLNSGLQKGANSLSMDISGVAAGHYFLKIHGTYIMEIEKIVIMR
ncbi:MAG TPA: T9SS type A sorting domain-containing protein [Puia sp.]|nr:T9SS type A sorting domain-containing protein [Puia sp.]